MLKQNRPEICLNSSKIGARCYELRIRDRDKDWRIIYRVDSDAIVIVEVLNNATDAGRDYREMQGAPEEV